MRTNILSAYEIRNQIVEASQTSLRQQLQEIVLLKRQAKADLANAKEIGASLRLQVRSLSEEAEKARYNLRLQLLKDGLGAYWQELDEAMPQILQKLDDQLQDVVIRSMDAMNMAEDLREEQALLDEAWEDAKKQVLRFAKEAVDRYFGRLNGGVRRKKGNGKKGGHNAARRIRRRKAQS